MRHWVSVWATLLHAAACVATTVTLVEKRDTTLRSQQTGFAMKQMRWQTVGQTRPENANTWGSDAFEYIPLEWRSVMHNRTSTGMRVEEAVARVAGVAARGKQAILGVRGHGHYNDPFTQYGSAPMFLEAEGVSNCTDRARLDTSNDYGRKVLNYNEEPILTAIEATAAALGAALNGDKRLFAVEVGFVGYDGHWLHGLERSPNWRCPLPNAKSAERIIKAMAVAFSKSFVLMPRPWNAPSFPYAKYPQMGIADAAFATGFPYEENLKKVGLADRWRTAPVVAHMYKPLRECWFAANSTQACHALGLSRGVNHTSYADALKERHPVAVVSNELYFRHKADAAVQKRLKQAFTQTGAILHMQSVTLQRLPQALAVCAVVSNIGSAPVYAPSSNPVNLQLSLGVSKFTLRSTNTSVSDPGITGLMPGETRVFAVNAAFLDATDECTEFAAVCKAVGQTCEDSNKDPLSRNDWVCKCTTGETERGRPALCGTVTTLKHDDLTYFDGTGAPALKFGTYSSLGMRDASFTVSMQVYMKTVEDDKNIPAGFKHVWAPQTFFSSETYMTKPQDGFVIVFRARELHAITEGAGWDCATKTQMTMGGNKWMHVVTVYDKPSATLEIFVDTVSMAKCTSFPPNLGNQPVVIGRDWSTASNLLGWTRDIRVMKGALKLDGIKRLYAPRGYIMKAAPAVVGLNTDFRVRDLHLASTHPNLTADGLSLTIPDKQAAPSSEGCFWDSSPAPDTPVPAPTSKLADLRVGMCATLQVAADGQPCGGRTFNRVGFSHWTSTNKKGIVRTLWPSSPLGEYVLCTTGGEPGGHFFLNMSQLELQSRATCTLATTTQTNAPPTLTPPTPAPSTPHPATPAPATPAPPTPAPPTPAPKTPAPPTPAPPTSVPPTPAPPTPAPPTSAPPTGVPGVPPTPAPPTPTPPTPAPPTPAPPTGAPPTGVPGVPPTPAPPTPTPPTGAPPTPAPPTGAPPTGVPGVPPTPAPATTAPTTPLPGSTTPAPQENATDSATDDNSTADGTPSPMITNQPADGNGTDGMPNGTLTPLRSSAIDTSEGAELWAFVLLLVLCVCCCLMCGVAWVMACRQARHTDAADRQKEKWASMFEPGLSIHALLEAEGSEPDQPSPTNQPSSPAAHTSPSYSLQSLPQPASSPGPKEVCSV